MTYTPPPRLDDNQYAAFVKFFVNAAKTYKQEVRLLDRIYGRPGEVLELVITERKPAEFQAAVKIKMELFVSRDGRSGTFKLVPDAPHIGSSIRIVVLNGDYHSADIIGNENRELTEFVDAFLASDAADPRELDLQASRRRQAYFEKELPFVGDERFKGERKKPLRQFLRGALATKIAITVGVISLVATVASTRPEGAPFAGADMIAGIFLMSIGLFNLKEAAEGRGRYLFGLKQIAAGALLIALVPLFTMGPMCGCGVDGNSF